MIYELRVTSYELEFFYASCELYFASWQWKLQVANLFYELRVTIQKLLVTFYEMKTASGLQNFIAYFLSKSFVNFK